MGLHEHCISRKLVSVPASLIRAYLNFLDPPLLVSLCGDYELIDKFWLFDCKKMFWNYSYM